MKKTISLILVLALWAGLTAFAWFKPAAEFSDAERRPLEQFPEISGDELISGQFMKDFADYAVDQFPLRDGFRTLNAYLTYYLLGQKDNNGIYLHDGYAAKMEYPMNEKSISYAIARFNELYEMYLTDCNVRFALVPDKGYYLAEDAGALSMDYDALYERMTRELDWAELIDLRPHLSIDSFYRTDTHWSQEAIVPAAEVIAASLGVTVPEFDRVVTLEKPFYGVYYGQAALPMEPDALHYLTNAVLENCTVKIHDNGQTAQVLDQTKLDSKDLYDVFLSGGAAVLQITNPAGSADRETTARWLKQIEAAFPGMPIQYDDLSMGVSCHTGEGALGVDVQLAVNPRLLPRHRVVTLGYDVGRAADIHNRPVRLVAVFIVLQYNSHLAKHER